MKNRLEVRLNIISGLLIAGICFVFAINASAQGITQEKARANFLQSLPNFKTAAKVVIGRDKTESQLSQYFNGLFAIKYQMKNIIGLDEATTYLKEYLANPGNSALRREVVENIYWDARGRKPNNDEMMGFDTLIKLKKSWYAKEIQNQSDFFKNPAYVSDKNQMVNLAYKSAFCRDANPAELKASTSTLYINEIFALRELLWSSSYTALRNETIRSWWQSRFKKAPTASNLEVAIERFEPVKAICSEMSKRWDITDIK